MEDNRKNDDTQILTEIVSNERILEYPGKEKIRFRFPTLQIQRKIDSAVRYKKKLLRDTVDEIPDTNNPGQLRVVPAYKSKNILQQEYERLGWWTPEDDARLDQLSQAYIINVTKLEMLGFESLEKINDLMEEARVKIEKTIDNELEKQNLDELNTAILRLTIVSVDSMKEDIELIKANAFSTEVDDALAEIESLKLQYKIYVDLANDYSELNSLEQEKTSLFADSWQNQLDYFTRLAQVFYCTEYADTKTPIFDSIDLLENCDDTAFVSWLFTELHALWQGLSDEARERMGKYGFTRRLSTDKSSSEESPDQPESKEDGALPEKTESISTEVLDTPKSLPQPNLTS